MEDRALRSFPRFRGRVRSAPRCRDGTWETRYWDTVNIPVLGPDGAMRYVLHQTADVTSQVRGEAAAASAEGILERMGDAYCVLDRDFRFVGVNTAAERLLGRPRETLLGRSHWKEFPASVDAPVGRALRRVVADGVEQHLTHHYAAEGYDLHLEVDAYPTDEGGVAMFWRDLTERVRAEAALRLAVAHEAYRIALTDALRGAEGPVETQAVATRLLGDHLGASRVMYGEADPGSAETFTNHREYRRDSAMPTSLGGHRWDDFGAYVATEMRTGRTLVVDEVCVHPGHSADDLAAYAAVGIRAYVAVPPVREGRIMAYLAVNRTLAAEKSHQLRIHRPDENLYVSGDRARLVQTVTNLLHNAIKYTDPHGTITLAASTTEQELVLSVQDTGVGIAAELLPHIFDLFMQSERSLDRSQGALGIGLSVVRHLVGMHHGTLQAHSAGPGQGSTFEIRLPRISAPHSVEEAVVTPSTPRRLLIVDDNRDAADSLALLLTSEGHDVDVVYRSTDALERVAQQLPDVVLLDIGMPELDGYAVARAIRARHGNALRVIALTGYGGPEDRERSGAAGFDAHLVKPVDVQTLLCHLGD